MTWNTKKKKFVRGDGAGADNVKTVRTESGVKLPASYRSGRFDEWRAKTRRMSLPRVGEAVPERGPQGLKRFKHTSITAAKPLDKLAKNYERKVRVQKKADSVAGEAVAGETARKPHRTKRLIKRYGGKPLGQARSEIKSADQIRKAREVMAKRKAKNARPSHKKRRR
jgi:ATP-dependent RNA helicase DDX54/DBP10